MFFLLEGEWTHAYTTKAWVKKQAVGERDAAGEL
jgi:hypothetical protein